MIYASRQSNYEVVIAVVVKDGGPPNCVIPHDATCDPSTSAWISSAQQQNRRVFFFLFIEGLGVCPDLDDNHE